MIGGTLSLALNLVGFRFFANGFASYHTHEFANAYLLNFAWRKGNEKIPTPISTD
jgi:hypothetical protein